MLILADTTQHSLLQLTTSLSSPLPTPLACGWRNTPSHACSSFLMQRKKFSTFLKTVFNSQLVTELFPLFEMRLLYIYSCWMSGDGWEATSEPRYQCRSGRLNIKYQLSAPDKHTAALSVLAEKVSSSEKSDESFVSAKNASLWRQKGSLETISKVHSYSGYSERNVTWIRQGEFKMENQHRGCKEGHTVVSSHVWQHIRSELYFHLISQRECQSQGVTGSCSRELDLPQQWNDNAYISLDLQRGRNTPVIGRFLKTNLSVFKVSSARTRPNRDQFNFVLYFSPWWMSQYICMGNSSCTVSCFTLFRSYTELSLLLWWPRPCDMSALLLPCIPACCFNSSSNHHSGCLPINSQFLFAGSDEISQPGKENELYLWFISI